MPSPGGPSPKLYPYQEAALKRVLECKTPIVYGAHGKTIPGDFVHGSLVGEFKNTKLRDRMVTMGHFHMPKRLPWYKRLYNALLGRLGYATGGYVACGVIGDFDIYAKPGEFVFPNHAIYPPPITFYCMEEDDPLFEPSAIETAKFDPGREHYQIEVRGHDVIVTGASVGRSPSTGIHTSYFEPHAVYHVDGLRLRALEAVLTDKEWSGIGEQIDAQIGE